MAKAKNTYDATYTIGANDETAAGIKSATASLTSPIDKITAKWATLDRAIGLSAGIYLAGKAFNILEKAFQQFTVAVEQQQKRISFDNLARSVGSSSSKIISELKKASHETITFQRAIETAGRSILLGLDAKILPRLMEIAKASSKVTGQTVVAAYEDITLGVARQSKMILDNLGIVVDYEIHLAKLASSLGKTKDNLNEVERRQAFMNAVMEAGEKIINKVGVSYETLNEKIEKFKTSLVDGTDQIKAHIFGLDLLDKAIGAQKYPKLVDEYEKGKKALDELLPKYNKLKEAIEAIKAGEREPSRFLSDQFTDAEIKVKALQKQLNGISKMLGVEGTVKIIPQEEDVKEAIAQTDEYWKKWEENMAKAADNYGKSILLGLKQADEHINNVIVNGQSLEKLVDNEYKAIAAGWATKEAEMKNTIGYRLGVSLGEGFSFGAKTTLSNGLYDLITDEFNAKSTLTNALKLSARILSDSFAEEFLKTFGAKFSPAKFFLNLFTNTGQAVGAGVVSGGGVGANTLTSPGGGVGKTAIGSRTGQTNNTFNYYITDDPTLQKRINEGVRKSFRDNNLRQDVKGLS